MNKVLLKQAKLIGYVSLVSKPDREIGD